MPLTQLRLERNHQLARPVVCGVNIEPVDALSAYIQAAPAKRPKVAARLLGGLLDHRRPFFCTLLSFPFIQAALRTPIGEIDLDPLAIRVPERLSQKNRVASS
jgi:hypothetical protein